MSSGDDDKTGRERRQHERYDTELTVDYGSGETFLFAYITNISAMGIFIRSEDPAPVGTRLSLRFTPKDDEALELSGEVAWVNPVKQGPENLNPGMGVRFVELTAPQRERVVELVRTVAYLRDDEESD